MSRIAGLFAKSQEVEFDLEQLLAGMLWRLADRGPDSVPVINLRHAFLPAFAGARPSARVKRRGVKLIGAAAHSVTEQLDAAQPSSFRGAR